MWILLLNPMRGNYETLQSVARAVTKEELEAFVRRETVEPYCTLVASAFGGETNFQKTFRPAGPLEWFNRPGGRSYLDVGTADDWAAQARGMYEHDVLSLPEVHNDE